MPDDNEDDKRTCPECKSTKLASDFQWTHDRYGIPWKKVCDGCYEAVSDQIAGFVFDASGAGESLEPEDY